LGRHLSQRAYLRQFEISSTGYNYLKDIDLIELPLHLFVSLGALVEFAADEKAVGVQYYH
jgi:hypothetical protein